MYRVLFMYYGTVLCALCLPYHTHVYGVLQIMSINNEDRRCLVGYIFNLHAQNCGTA